MNHAILLYIIFLDLNLKNKKIFRAENFLCPTEKKRKKTTENMEDQLKQTTAALTAARKALTAASLHTKFDDAVEKNLSKLSSMVHGVMSNDSKTQFEATTSFRKHCPLKKILPFRKSSIPVLSHASWNFCSRMTSQNYSLRRHGLSQTLPPEHRIKRVSSLKTVPSQFSSNSFLQWIRMFVNSPCGH